MDELVKQVAKKTGLPEEQARLAVTTVINYLKKKLPAPVASQIDGVLGNADMAKGVAEQAKGLMSKLGKK